MKRARVRDVINVNRIWIVYQGSWAYGSSIGSVQAADRVLAISAARRKYSETRRLFVDELK